MNTFPETSPEELIKRAKGEQNDKIAVIADPNVGEDILSQLISDPDPAIRVAVAQRGYGLFTLSKDRSELVRKAVIEQGGGIENFLYDPCVEIREELAKKLGYYLSVLQSDPAPSVRAKVAEQGVGLNALAYDTDKQVRIAVAKQGYSGYAEEIRICEQEKEKLLLQKDWNISEVQRKGLLKQTKKDNIAGLLQERNGDIQRLANDPDRLVRLAAAEDGIGLDTLVYDSDKLVSETAYTTLRNLAHDIVMRFQEEEELRKLATLACEVRHKTLLDLVSKYRELNDK